MSTEVICHFPNYHRIFAKLAFSVVGEWFNYMLVKINLSEYQLNFFLQNFYYLTMIYYVKNILLTLN